MMVFGFRLMDQINGKDDDSWVDEDKEQVDYVNEEESVTYDEAEGAGISEDEQGEVEVDEAEPEVVNVEEELEVGVDEEADGEYSGEAEGISESPLEG